MCLHLLRFRLRLGVGKVASRNYDEREKLWPTFRETASIFYCLQIVPYSLLSREAALSDESTWYIEQLFVGHFSDAFSKFGHVHRFDLAAFRYQNVYLNIFYILQINIRSVGNISNAMQNKVPAEAVY